MDNAWLLMDSNYQYQGTQTISNKYTTEALITTAIPHMFNYQPEWSEDYWGWGYYDWDNWLLAFTKFTLNPLLLRLFDMISQLFQVIIRCHTPHSYSAWIEFDGRTHFSINDRKICIFD